MSKTQLAWWFSAKKVLPHNDGRRIAIGRTHSVKGLIAPCHNGLHASAKLIDALKYAPGPILWRVELSGEVVPHSNDKFAASHRTYVGGGVDVSDALRKFARRCALDAVHLWDAPEVVVQYLKTGNEDIRAAARAAARDAAWAAARAAVRDAAWAAAWAAVRDAAWAAARAAARDAAWAAAMAAARDAAWDAAWEKQNRRLTAMLTHAIRRPK